MNTKIECKDEMTLRYEHISHQINREDGLVNHRLTWALTLNGFLFTALGFLGAKEAPNQSILAFFHWALPLTGTIVCVAGFLGVIAAQMQIHYLTREWNEWNLSSDSHWPRPFGRKDSWFGSFVIGTVPALAPPVILAIVWIGLWFSWH